MQTWRADTQVRPYDHLPAFARGSLWEGAVAKRLRERDPATQQRADEDIGPYRERAPR